MVVAAGDECNGSGISKTTTRKKSNGGVIDDGGGDGGGGGEGGENDDDNDDRGVERVLRPRCSVYFGHLFLQIKTS